MHGGRHCHILHRHSRVGGNLGGGQVILALRQYPQRGANNPARHCRLDPQSRGEAAGLTTRQTNAGPSYWLQGSIHSAGDNKTKQPPLFPISLDGRGPKPVPVPDTGAKGENKTVPSLHPVVSRLRGNDGLQGKAIHV